MSEKSGLPIRKLPAARGLAWVSGSWQLVRRQPLRLLLIALFFQFFLGFSQAQLVGLVVILCLPVLSAACFLHGGVGGETVAGRSVFAIYGQEQRWPVNFARRHRHGSRPFDSLIDFGRANG